MKRRRLLIIGLAMLLCLLFCGGAEAKAPSNKKLKKSYTQYINKKYSSAYRYMLIDLNGDGVKECMVCHDALSSGRGYSVSVLSYRRKKVVCMYDSMGAFTIRFSKKKKQLCFETSSGASSYMYTLLKVKKKKATIVHSYKQKQKYLINHNPSYVLKFYKSNDDMIYNRGKEITEKEFRSVEKRILKWKDITLSSKWKKI